MKQIASFVEGDERRMDMPQRSIFKGKEDNVPGSSKKVEEYEKAFCEYLRDWMEKHTDHGDHARFAKLFGVSPQQWSNILAGRRAMNESWRRGVASFLGLSYDEMISAAKPAKGFQVPPGILKCLKDIHDLDPETYTHICETIIGKAMMLKHKEEYVYKHSEEPKEMAANGG